MHINVYGSSHLSGWRSVIRRWSSSGRGFLLDYISSLDDDFASTCRACAAGVLMLTRQHSTIATSIVHSKLDYCNSLYYNLPKSQITRLQQIQNSLARVVVKTPKCCHITPILHSLHWLKITERIEYKLLSLTYKILTTTQHPYLHNLISVQ